MSTSFSPIVLKLKSDFFLYKINRLDFLMEIRSVLCKIGGESLCVMHVSLFCKELRMLLCTATYSSWKQEMSKMKKNIKNTVIRIKFPVANIDIIRINNKEKVKKLLSKN
jgi:hypothetical protein